jgi:hypothetical protein
MAKNGFFEVINIHRDDIKAYIEEIDSDKLTDEQMEEICEKTKECLLNNDFWEYVRIACRELPNLPRK